MYFVGSGRGAVRIDGHRRRPGADRDDRTGRHRRRGRLLSRPAAERLGRGRNPDDGVAILARRASRDLQKEMPDLAFRFHEGIAAMMAARLTSTNRLVRFLSV